MIYLSNKSFQMRKDDIEKKYDVFYTLFGRWMEQVKKTQMKNFAERNCMPVYQKYNGLRTGIEILHYARTHKRAIEILQQQIDEPSIPDNFRAGVKLILHDVIADSVCPIELQNLLTA